MKPWARRTAACLAALFLAAISVSALPSAEARGGGGGGGGRGFGGRRPGARIAKRQGAQAQTLIDDAVRRDNARRARRLLG